MTCAPPCRAHSQPVSVGRGWLLPSPAPQRRISRAVLDATHLRVHIPPQYDPMYSNLTADSRAERAFGFAASAFPERDPALNLGLTRSSGDPHAGQSEPQPSMPVQCVGGRTHPAPPSPAPCAASHTLPGPCAPLVSRARRPLAGTCPRRSACAARTRWASARLPQAP
jgi:hypothetical protein